MAKSKKEAPSSGRQSAPAQKKPVRPARAPEDAVQEASSAAPAPAKDGMEAAPNCIYIIPPDRDISIFHGALHLMKPVERRGLRHPIDFFFRSLAADQREKAVCIVLSGTGTEGILGLKEIKGEGGLCWSRT